MEPYDVAIIGGGPAGVAAGVYAARKKLRTVLITDNFGGQSVVSAEIQNWIGTTVISGLALAENLEAHLRAQENIEIAEGARAASVAPEGNGFGITTEADKKFYAKTILLATGSGRRRLGVPGEREFEGKGVVYCATCDAPLFGGKDVAVVGGGNAGLEAVVCLLPYARHIFLLECTGALRGDEVTIEKIEKQPSVEVITDAEAEAIVGERMVRGIRYRPVGGGAPVEIPVDGVFVEIGIVPSSDVVRGLVALNGRGEVTVDPRTQATSRAGIWAAGDVTDGLYRQNNISAGDAVKAILNIWDFLNG